jgi:hypothetical protein
MLPLSRCSAALLLTFVLTPANVHAQMQWTIEPKSSLAWWQMSPHLNHLWATTCPAEPSWRPGEGRSAGWFIDRWLKAPTKGDQNVGDTINVPLYPRFEANDVCTEAVRGEIIVTDTVRWRGVRGKVAVLATHLVTGLDQRDEYARKAILEVGQYPEIIFTIDSLVDVTRHADTLRGSAMGAFSLHGVTKPMVASVQAWRETAGLRVTAKLRTSALSIVNDYGLSSFALGLGIGTRIWQILFMGVDVVLVPAPRGGTGSAR